MATCNLGAGNLGPDTVFVQPGPPNLPPPNIILQDPHCNNGCDGQITVVPNGGTGVTTISWNGGSTNFTLNNLCSGNYPLIWWMPLVVLITVLQLYLTHHHYKHQLLSQPTQLVLDIVMEPQL